MGETLHLLFARRDDGSYELRVRESWSGRTVCGTFVPPFTTKQLNALYKKLNRAAHEDDQRDTGYRLFLALCGSEPGSIPPRALEEQSTQAVLRNVIRRTLQHRETVALTVSFAPGCEEFLRYPWELLHNGEHFLIVSGIFTLTRALVRPDQSSGGDLPVAPPMRLLYISASPRDCESIETEQSYQALEYALTEARENNLIILDKIEQVTHDKLVDYLSDRRGAGLFDTDEMVAPCYAIHYDGHGAFGRLCPDDACNTLNEANARTCAGCRASLSGAKPQTYLCFCDDDGNAQYIDTQTLCDLLLNSDVRLAVFSACETATLASDSVHARQHDIAFNATLATALVMAGIPAVVAMPFSLQDDFSPTFVSHFYEAVGQGRTLEEALSRARRAMLQHRRQGWYVPVLYRQVSETQAGPVPLLSMNDEPEDHDHPLTHLRTSSIFVGRETELSALSELLAAAARGEAHEPGASGRFTLRRGIHHIAITGSTGIGKSALALEAVRRSQDWFPGAVIGISLQNGKLFGEALMEIAHALHVTLKPIQHDHPNYREEQVLGALRARASRELPCLLLLDSFEEVKEYTQLELWHHFLRSLPQEVIVLVTSRSNPMAITIAEGAPYSWYEFPVGKMKQSDLLRLFSELASSNGLDQRIHLDQAHQQEILREICDLLDGFPLGAELIFGASRYIGGKMFAPEAATRSLEEVRDELRDTRLDGIWAALEVAYLRLSPLARLLLSYLAAFKLPFSRDQIIMLVAPETLGSTSDAVALKRPLSIENGHSEAHNGDIHVGEAIPAELAQGWRETRDELVQSSFIEFDGRVYRIHSQVRNFALSYLPLEERRRVHRVVASYYINHPQTSPEEWFVAYEHLENAGETQDLREAVRVAVQASWVMTGRGYTRPLLAMLRRAEALAKRLGDTTGEGKIQCCIGAILRNLGKYAEAAGCLTRSRDLHHANNERKEEAWALYELAVLAREEGDFRQAGQYAQEALRLFNEADDWRGLAWTQMVLSEVSRGFGNYYDARGHVETAIENFQRLQNAEGRARALRDRGTISEALGNYRGALTDYEEALRSFNELGLRDGQAWILADQSVVYMDQGRYDRAQQACNEAIAIFRELGIQRGEGWALRSLGDIARHRRDYASARSYYDDASTIFTRIGNRFDQARVCNSLGANTFAEGDILDAQDYYEQALTISREEGARLLEGRALRGLGDVYRAFKDFTGADDSYRAAYTIAEELDTPAERCAVLRHMGFLRVSQNRPLDALDCWIQALALDHRLGHEARSYMQEHVEKLVAEHHLEEEYAALRQKYGLG